MAEESTKKPNRRPERIGKYDILERIAVGGMGIVYKARDSKLDRLVALKILPPDLAKQATTLERFQREAKAAAQLRHENIVSIYDVDVYKGAHFIALEYVDGTDLQEYIGRNCRIDPNEARLLMIQAARALGHAHEHGIVHRDIKPSNFLLLIKDKHIVLKLADFGLAMRTENEDEFRLTKDKTTVGTVDYMSPEQARDSRSADIRSDIYSLGCTFYHMLSGTAPFATGTLPERIVQHMRTPAPDLRKLNQSVPEALVVIIQRMLAKKPDERYQTPAELLHELENLDKVELPRKSTAPGKRGRFISRISRTDVTSVIESKDIEEASAEPAQVKAPRVKKKPAIRLDKLPSEDDESIDEPASDEVEDTEDAEDKVEAVKAKAKPAPARTKNPVAAGSPVWMYVVGGMVAVMGLILVLAFTMGSRPPLPKKESEKKVEPGPAPVAVIPDKKPDSPETIVPDPPPTMASIDTSPEKMTVLVPALPRMDFDPAKADVPALRKEFLGPFETFPAVPDNANLAQVRRLSMDGATAYSSISDALAQTKADQFNVIDIADNGPIFVSSLPVVSKRTILVRGAEGYRPLLVWDIAKQSADSKPAIFLALANGRLILENLDFVMHAPAKTPMIVFDLPESDFYARDCTFSIAGKSTDGIPLIRRVNPKPIGVEAVKTQTWLRRCYVRGPDAQLLRHHETPADVLIEESLVVGYQHPLLAIRAKDEDFLALNCVRSTLVTGQVLARWQAANGQRLNPYFQARMLDSILSRDDPTAPQGDMLQLVDTGETNRMQWRASNSVYAGWKQLLATKATNIAGHDLDAWHRHWSYSLSDRAVGDAWPSGPPSNLDEVVAPTFYPAKSPLAYSALTSSGAVGCVIGRLPSAPEHWHERTMEPRQIPIFANIETEPPRIDPANDGMYHGERLDLNKIDLGAHLTAMLQKMPPAPRVVMHLTGKGVCSTSLLRVQGLQNLVLYFEPAKDPLTLEANPTSFKQRGPLIEMTGGHLEMIGARIRLSQVTFIPTMIHAQGAHLTLSRCWLAGPLAKSVESFNSVITVSNPNATPTTLLMRENVLVSSKLLIQVHENVQVKARNNVLVSLGDGIRFDVATPTDSLQHLFDHNTWAVRQAFMRLRAGPDSTPTGSVLMLVNSNAFLRPFDGEPERATLTRGFESWSAMGRWSWQGRYNLYDARVPAFHVPGPTKNVKVKQSLKDWQRTWGQVGEQEAQVLDASLATRELSLEGATGASAFAQLDRLKLPSQIRVDVTQGIPGADLGILKKKGL